MQNGQRIGPYLLHQPLGEGGMAQVWKAWNEGLGRFEALKFPLVRANASGGEAAFVARFLQEARTAANLHHAHIAIIYSVSSDAAQPYFAMKFIAGQGIDDLLRERGKLGVEETLAILEPVASALDYAHQNGVIHRDIKPANILLEKSGDGYHPYVVDFGIARAAQEAGGVERTRLTQAGSIIGTPEYMSPEQAQSQETTKCSDLYSLGVVAYEMLCGRPPFHVATGASPISVLVQHVKDPPPPPQSLGADVPPAVATALLSALHKDPAERPSSCHAWIDALRFAHQPLPVTVPVTTGVTSSGTILMPSGSATDPSLQADRPDFQAPSPARPQFAWLAIPALAILAAFGLGYGAFAPKAAPAPTPASMPVSVALSPTADPRLEQARTLAKQAMADVDESTAALQELDSRLDEKAIAREDAVKELETQTGKLNNAYALATRAVRLDENSEEAWVQLCRATIYLDKCGARNSVEKAATRFPNSSRFKPLISLAKVNAKDGCR